MFKRFALLLWHKSQVSSWKTLSTQRFLCLYNRLYLREEIHLQCRKHPQTHKNTLCLSCRLFGANPWTYIVIETPHKSFMKCHLTFSIEKLGFITSNLSFSSYKAVDCTFSMWILVKATLYHAGWVALVTCLSAEVGENSMHLKKLRSDKSCREARSFYYAPLSQCWRFKSMECCSITRGG